MARQHQSGMLNDRGLRLEFKAKLDRLVETALQKAKEVSDEPQQGNNQRHGQEVRVQGLRGREDSS